MVAKYTTADLGEAVHNHGDLRPEDVLQVLHRVVGVFHNVVEQGRTDARRAQPHLLAGYLRHGNGVHDVGLARQAAHTLVGLARKVERLGNDVYLLAVARMEVRV